MKTQVLAATTACVLATLMLAGCTPPVKVKTVLADPTAYLDAHFSPAQLAQEVRDTITQADNQPLGFRKMGFTLSWTTNADDPAKASHVDETVTMSNAGGSFVQIIKRASRNGVPIRQSYQLTYRGLLVLRFQPVSMNATNAGITIATHKLTHFDAIGTAPSPLEYDYTVGLPAALTHSIPGHQTCTQGKPYPASKVFASLAGQARAVDCSVYNMNNAVAGTYRFAYLDHYGVAIEIHATGTSGISDAKVTAVNVQ